MDKIFATVILLLTSIDENLKVLVARLNVPAPVAQDTKLAETAADANRKQLKDVKPVETKPAPSTDASIEDDLAGDEPTKPAARAMTQADVVEAVRSGVAAHGRDSIKAILSKFGSERATQVKAEDYDAFVTAVKALKGTK